MADMELQPRNVKAIASVGPKACVADWSGVERNGVKNGYEGPRRDREQWRKKNAVI